jgi:hypothetical protein
MWNCCGFKKPQNKLGLKNKKGLTNPNRCGIIKVLKERLIQMKKEMFKKTGDELQQYLQFRRRGSVVRNKKGKGSYDRNKGKRVSW